MLTKYITSKPQKIRALGNNVLCILDITMITQGAYRAIVGGVNNITMSSKVVMPSHCLDQLTPLKSGGARNLEGAWLINGRKPELGLSTSLKIGKGVE